MLSQRPEKSQYDIEHIKIFLSFYHYGNLTCDEAAKKIIDYIDKCNSL